MMTHTELSHLVLYFSNACQTSPLFHHLDHAFIFHFGSNIATVLHQLSEADVLNDRLYTL